MNAKSLSRTLAAAAVLLLGGCISYQSDTHSGHEDIPHVSFLQHITLGETHSAWLVTQFGQPSAVRRPNPETLVWQYENVETRSKKIRALPLFAIELNDAKRIVYNFEIENDRIMRYWQESAS